MTPKIENINYAGSSTIIIKLSLMVALCFLFSSNAFSQYYYPAPAPIRDIMEPALLQKLQHQSPGKDKITTLLSLSNIYYNKTIKYSSNLIRGLSYAEQAKQLSIQLRDNADYNNAQLQIAYILIELNNYGGAESILPAVNDSTKEKLLLTLSLKYYNRSTGNDNINHDSAMLFVQKANVLADKLHQKSAKILCLKYMGMIHVVQGNLPLAEKELLTALAQYKQIGYRDLQYPYLELTSMYTYKGDYDKALASCLQALHYMALTKDTINAGDIYYIFSGILSHDSQKQKGLYYAQLAFEAYKHQLGYGYITIPFTVGEIVQRLLSIRQYQQALTFVLANYKTYPPTNAYEKSLYLGNIGDCYLKLKQYDKAEGYFIDEFNTLKSENFLTEATYHRMAYFYVESKKYTQAKPYLLAALKQENTISIGKRNHLHYMLFLVDSAAGDYLSAIKNLSLTKRYDDTVYKKGKVTEIQRLMVQYDTQNKNNEISLLQQKDKLEAANLKQANEVRNLTIAVVLVLIIAGSVFLRQYIQKQRSSALIAQKNKQLEKLLTEKEWLLKEVHHRVKNNLHTVISLLEIQAEFLENDALKAIETSQHRIYAMSLLHQKLYTSDDLKTVEMADYIPELIGYLKDGFGSEQKIAYCLNIQPIQLDVSQAMPLGLIINEAVSNSIKHAFTRKKDKIITIQMHTVDKNVILKIADNGTGFNDKAAFVKQGSLGLKLIKGLSEDLNAEILFENDKGTHITIKFIPSVFNADDDLAKINKESEAKFEG